MCKETRLGNRFLKITEVVLLLEIGLCALYVALIESRKIQYNLAYAIDCALAFVFLILLWTPSRFSPKVWVENTGFRRKSVCAFSLLSMAVIGRKLFTANEFEALDCLRLWLYGPMTGVSLALRWWSLSQRNYTTRIVLIVLPFASTLLFFSAWFFIKMCLLD